MDETADKETARVAGWACPSCGGVLEGDQMKRMGCDTLDFEGGLPSCGPCEEPLELMLMKH